MRMIYIHQVYCLFHPGPKMQHRVLSKNDGLFGMNNYFEDDISEPSCHTLPLHSAEYFVPLRDVDHGYEATDGKRLSKHLETRSNDERGDDLSMNFHEKMSYNNGSTLNHPISDY